MMEDREKRIVSELRPRLRRDGRFSLDRGGGAESEGQLGLIDVWTYHSSSCLGWSLTSCSMSPPSEARVAVAGPFLNFCLTEIIEGRFMEKTLLILQGDDNEIPSIARKEVASRKLEQSMKRLSHFFSGISSIVQGRTILHCFLSTLFV